MVKFIAPIREKALDLQKNKPLLQSIIKQGADKARASANATMQLVRKGVLGD
jgi:tryptophanyl-tRNA synthetase